MSYFDANRNGDINQGVHSGVWQAQGMHTVITPFLPELAKRFHATCCIRKFSLLRIKLFPGNALIFIRHCQHIDPILYHSKAFHSECSDNSSEPGFANNVLVSFDSEFLDPWNHWILEFILHNTFQACLCSKYWWQRTLRLQKLMYALKSACFFSKY